MFGIFEIFEKKMRFLIEKYKIEKNRKSEKIEGDKKGLSRLKFGAWKN